MGIFKDEYKVLVKNFLLELLSFKFLSFFTVIFLIVAAWIGLERLFIKTVLIAKSLYLENIIDKDNVTKLITHSQTVLYDSALGHIMLTTGAILSAIIAVKGVAYIMDSKKDTEVLKKLTNGDVSKNISRFVSKK